MAPAASGPLLPGLLRLRLLRPGLPVIPGGAVTPAPAASGAPLLLPRSCLALPAGKGRLYGGGQRGLLCHSLPIFHTAQLGQLLQRGFHIALGPLALSAADHTQLAIMIGLGAVRVRLQPYLGGLTQQVDAADCPRSVGSFHKRLLLGGMLDQILIGLLLIF